MRRILLALVVVLLCPACRQLENNEPKVVTSSDDVPALKSFIFRSDINSSLFQDITFKKQPDNSYSADVVHGVDLSDIKPTYDYEGEVRKDGLLIVNSATSVSFGDEFVIQFDEKHVIFRVVRYYTIPTVVINTRQNDPIISKTQYIKCSVQINGKNLYADFQSQPFDSAGIRGRGNSTWIYYDKRPYRLKFGTKESILGLPAAKSWILLANYRDPTNFMNAVTFDMARYLGMEFSNSNRFVEVYLNEKYIGMYQLTEQIQQGTNRVNIDENAGVLLSLDLDDGPHYSPAAGNNFYSTVYNLPVAVKHPQKVSASTLESIKADFGQLEELIRERNMNVLTTRLDIESMIHFLIIQEMTRNVELVSPRSMYLYKDENEVYHFGPVWDFDGGYAFDWASMSTGHNYFGSQTWLMGATNPSTHPSSAYNYISGFFVSLFSNEQFVNAYKSRWREVHKDMLDYCFSQLDTYSLHCDSAMKNNAKRWPIGRDYKIEIDRLKAWLSLRATKYSTVVESY